MLNPFTPGGTVNVTATDTTANAALAAGTVDQVLVTVPAGDAMAFVAFGDSTVEADAATSTPILPGAAYIFTIGPETTHIAAITGTGAATVYATGGQGE